MEAQAQEEMEREVACDVVFRSAEPAPRSQIVEAHFADVGDAGIRSVRAQLREPEASSDEVADRVNWADSVLTTEAIQREGRTLVRCGTRVSSYDSEGELSSDTFRIYRSVVVTTSSDS